MFFLLLLFKQGDEIKFMATKLPNVYSFLNVIQHTHTICKLYLMSPKKFANTGAGWFSNGPSYYATESEFNNHKITLNSSYSEL